MIHQLLQDPNALHIIYQTIPQRHFEVTTPRHRIHLHQGTWAAIICVTYQSTRMLSARTAFAVPPPADVVHHERRAALGVLVVLGLKRGGLH